MDNPLPISPPAPPLLLCLVAMVGVLGVVGVADSGECGGIGDILVMFGMTKDILPRDGSNTPAPMSCSMPVWRKTQ